MLFMRDETLLPPFEMRDRGVISTILIPTPIL